MEYRITIGENSFLLDEKKYEEAYALLSEIGDNDSIEASKYERAVKMLDEGNYKEAFELLKYFPVQENEELFVKIADSFLLILIMKRLLIFIRI